MIKKILLLIYFLLQGSCSISFSQVNVEWFRTYSAGWIKNFVNDFSIDSAGNCYMTGNVTLNSGETRTGSGTVKFNSIGELVWARIYEGSFTGLSEGNSLVIDEADNVYVLGTCSDIDSMENFFTLKYNASGEVQWVRKYQSSPNGRDEAVDIVLDNDNNIYVTGYTYYYGLPDYYFWSTIKYDSSGNLVWIEKFEGVLTSFKQPRVMVTDTYNNLYVCGFTVGLSGTSDFCTIKYDSAGKQQWINISDISNLRDVASDIQIDNLGNIYILGQSYNSDGFFTTLLKYNNNGEENWNAITDSTGENNGYYIRKNSFKLDQENKNVYIATTYRNYCCTIKYNSNGSLLWLSKYKSTEFPFSKGLGINIDRYGDIYTAGFTAIPVNVEPFLTLKYQPDGTLIWNKAFHVSNEHEYDEGAFVGFDKNNNIYIAGIYANTASSYKYGLLKYSQGVGISNISSGIPASYMLYQNYPNPFNPKTIMTYEIPVHSQVTLKVYDISGKVIYTLVNENQNAGKYEADFDGSELASGVYYYKLSAGDFITTKRMILLK